MYIYRIIIAAMLLGVTACAVEDDTTSPEDVAISANANPLAVKADAAHPTPVDAMAAEPAPVAAAPMTVETTEAATTAPAPKAVDETDPDAVASASLGILSELVGKEDPHKRGFSTQEEVASAELAASLPVFMVPLDKLQNYSRGSDPRDLLLDKQERMYAVSVDDDVKTGVVVRKRDSGKWTIAQFGNATVAKEANVARSRLTAIKGTATSAVSLIEIPTLHARLLAHENNGQLMLTPIADIAGTAATTGKTMAADKMFATLQKAAVQVPPNTNN